MCGLCLLTKTKEVKAMSDKEAKSQGEGTQTEGTPFADCMAQMMSACCPDMKERMAACAPDMSQLFSHCCVPQSETKTNRA